MVTTLQGPNAQPNPEQTASIASFLFYTFLDKTIWKAYNLLHLSYDELPSLCDYDDAAALKKRGYPVCITLVLAHFRI